MADDPAPPLDPAADQFPVAGDDVWIKAQFRQLTHGGCKVRVKSPAGEWQIILVDGAEVLCPLRVGHVLETYGQ
jgi:hypothetical protein